MDNEKLLAQIVTSTGKAIISCDLNGLINTWNPAAEIFFGYAQSDAMGRHICIIFQRTLQLVELEFINLVTSGHLVGYHETVFALKGGREIAGGVTVSAVFNREKELLGISYICWPEKPAEI